MSRRSVADPRRLTNNISRSGVIWRAGPSVAAIITAPHYRGSGPTWQFYHYSQMPWNVPIVIVPQLTVYDRKGNVTDVRKLG